LGARGSHYLGESRVEGEDPLAPFSSTAARHLVRTDGFEHVADIMVNSFYDEQLDEGCAFEELISFHGGMGGPQTRPFLLHPANLPLPGMPSSAPRRRTVCSWAGAACYRATERRTGRHPAARRVHPLRPRDLSRGVDTTGSWDYARRRARRFMPASDIIERAAKVDEDRARFGLHRQAALEDVDRVGDAVAFEARVLEDDDGVLRRLVARLKEGDDGVGRIDGEAVLALPHSSTNCLAVRWPTTRWGRSEKKSVAGANPWKVTLSPSVVMLRATCTNMASISSSCFSMSSLMRFLSSVRWVVHPDVSPGMSWTR
jgi:hypothetical protein